MNWELGGGIVRSRAGRCFPGCGSSRFRAPARRPAEGVRELWGPRIAPAATEVGEEAPMSTSEAGNKDRAASPLVIRSISFWALAAMMAAWLRPLLFFPLLDMPLILWHKDGLSLRKSSCWKASELALAPASLRKPHQYSLRLKLLYSARCEKNLGITFAVNSEGLLMTKAFPEGSHEIGCSFSEDSTSRVVRISINFSGKETAEDDVDEVLSEIDSNLSLLLLPFSYFDWVRLLSQT